MSHITILPTAGMGHLIPLVAFSKKLHHRRRTTTTILIPNDGAVSKAQRAFLDALPPYISYVFLTPVDLSDLSPEARIETRMSLTITRSLPHIYAAVEDILNNQSKKIDAFVVDLFGTDGFDVAFKHNIPAYIFFPSSGYCLSLFLRLPKLDEEVSGEYRDVQEKIQLPGCVPIHGSDLLDPVQDRKDEAYKWVLHHTKRYPLAQGVFLNSFKELDRGVIEHFERYNSKEKGSEENPKIYPVGPLVREGEEDDEEIDEKNPCLKWLDEQPNSSVLYVSFGSGGTLTHEQIIELALGLEKSEQRFLWVLRCPNEKKANANYFDIKDSEDPLAYLPKEFLQRTENRGLVVPLWAPQDKVLAHGSTGAFLTHCGWNSALESVVNGVPMIAWPLYAEQRMNAVMLYEDAKVALRFENGGRKGSNIVIGRDEIASVVRRLMEGEEGKEIRNRLWGLKEAAFRVLGEDGESSKALDGLVSDWR